jgi:Tfp pilus assembly PilM family ATPase
MQQTTRVQPNPSQQQDFTPLFVAIDKLTASHVELAVACTDRSGTKRSLPLTARQLEEDISVPTKTQKQKNK